MTEKFTYFWKGPFSQWDRRHPFVVKGITYATAEHYMMWFKDQVFSGGKLADEILASSHPSIAKALGREVEGFQKPIWDAVAKHGVFVGNLAKFTQHEDILHLLTATHGTTLVEASPEDRIWGIGLAENDPRALQRETWLGLNWLGEVLTDVRDALYPLASRIAYLEDEAFQEGVERNLLT